MNHARLGFAAALLFANATFALCAVAQAPAATQQPPRPPRVISPEIGADRRVTLRLLAPKADTVRLTGEILLGQRGPQLTKDSLGIWSVTVGPLPPDVYTYAFNVDGVSTPDPQNDYIKTVMSTGLASQLEVPGDGPQYYDARPVPHGMVSIVQYDSKSLGVPRAAWVYTPPGYQSGKGAYPLAFLLHGAGDTEVGWVLTGRANQILDNLIADGKAKPMIVVMPLGHARQTTGIAALVPPKPNTPGLGPDMGAGPIGQDLMKDLLPLVEKNFRVSKKADERAIMGLSMGGAQALRIGLGNMDQFHWIVGMSSALTGNAVAEPFKAQLDAPAVTNQKLKLLFLTIGKDDFLLAGNRAFDQALTTAGIKHTYRENEGAHTWLYWRRNLNDIVPLLFK